MKFKKLTVLALVACIAFTACGKDKKEPTQVNEAPSAQESVVTEPSQAQEVVTEPSEVQEDPTISTAFPSSGTVGDYTYELEPDFAVGLKYYDLTQRGFIWDSLDEPNAPVWITIASGEKSTGGYEINVVDIKEDGDGVIITVEEISPEGSETVTEALTYPCTTVRFEYGPNGTPNNFKVVNTEGEEYFPVG